MRIGRPALAVRVTLMRVALVWEWFWPTVSPLLLVLIGFLALAGTGILSLVPVWVHGMVLVGFLGLVGRCLYRVLSHLAVPDAAAGARRLERDNGLGHRPIAALADQPSGPHDDPFAAALWQAHQRRMAEAAARVRVHPPRRGLLSQDSYGARAALSLLLLISVVTAGPAFWPRIGAAFLPNTAFIPAFDPASYDLWLTPPDYTGLPPIYVTVADQTPAAGAVPPQSFTVPEGTSLLAEVHGGRTLPTLLRDGVASPFSKLGARDYTLSAPLGTPKKLSIAQGGTVLGSWDLSLIVDNPPAAAFVSPPKVGPKGVLQVDVKASHQWGVKTLALEFSKIEGSDKPFTIDLPLGGDIRKDVHSKITQDLTAHAWVGETVAVSVVATSVSGKIGRSEPVTLILPERDFRHPIARALAGERKILLRDPDEADGVAEVLDDLAGRPDLYQDNYEAYLMMTLAATQLRENPTPDHVTEVEDWIWRTALLIEDGTVSDALKDLRKAQQALQDALNRNAPDAEIDKLMRELREAMNRYTQGLIDKANRDHQPDETGDESGKTVTQQDLQRMLDRAERMAKSGSKDAAREALSQLQQMLEGLKTGRMAKGKGGNGQQAMRGLQDLTRKQQDLLDRSYKQAQRDQNGADDGQQTGKPGTRSGQQPGGKPGGKSGGKSGQGGARPGGGADEQSLGQEQDALRQQLNRLRQGMKGQGGEAGDALGRAEQAMKDAGDALKQGKSGEALGAEAEAMDDLQQAARALAEKNAGDEGGQREQAGRDPFGRDPGGPSDRFSDGDVKVPTESDMQRSRGILDELRRRSGERERPPIDRDYIDRLLRRF